MTGPSEDRHAGGGQGLDVPLEPLGDRRRIRGRLAAVAVVGVLAVVVVAAVAGRGPDRERTAVLPPEPSRAATTPPAEPSGTPEPSRADQRAEALPDLASRPLSGSPTAVFHGRRANDLLRYGWSGTDPALVNLPSVPGAFDGFGLQTATVSVASPTLDVWAIRGLGSFGGGPGDRVRLVDAAGAELWSSTDGQGFPVVPLWSPDGTRVALPGPSITWRILSVDPGGVVGTPLSLEVGPSVSRSLEPAGFSADGRWFYAIERRYDTTWRPSHRFSTHDGQSEAITALPTQGPERIAPEGRLGLSADPGTGRRYVSPGLPLSTGPTDVQVTEPDGSTAFIVRLDAIMGLAWTGDGRLLALEADHVPEPSRVRLVPIADDGTVGAPLLETGPLTWAGIVGVRDGHVLLAFSTSGAGGEGMLAMLRLDDGATATLRLDRATFGDLLLGGWLAAAG